MPVRVEGMNELEANFRRLNYELEFHALDEAVRTGAEIIRDRAAALAPVRTGSLARSIQVEMQPRKNPQVAHAHVGPDADHANQGWHVETGTRFMRAEPFLLPALESLRTFVTETMKEIFIKYLHKVDSGTR